MPHTHRNACAFELFLLWTVTILSPVVGTGSLIDAQCRMMCLNSHFSSSMLHTNGILEECSRHSNCSSCIYPCRTHFKSMELCEAKCQEASSTPALCLDSCTYVKLIKDENIGSCPSIESLGGFDKTCLITCTHDSDCIRRKQKCCYNGCGRTCQEPIIKNRNYPPKVDKKLMSITENIDGASVTVRWHVTRPPDPSDFALYAVQMRNSTKKKAHWTDVGVFGGTETIVYLKPGRNYQFKIAAVNQNGSLGYSGPSSPFHLSTEAQKPAVPENVESGSWSLAGVNSINMSLHWDPPRHSDLPIAKYRIFYSERPKDILPSIIFIEVLSVDVKGTETSCILPNLKPDMNYFVQVMAIARNLDKSRLSSNRSANYISTPSLPRGGVELPLDPIDRVVIKPNFTQTMPGPPRNLHNYEPFWDSEKETVKAKIKWKKPKGYRKTIDRFTIHWEATVCSTDSGDELWGSTHNTSFELYDLSFGCTYQVWVKPVFNGVWGHASTIQIMTLPCNEIAVKEDKPVCPMPVPDIPSAPQNMTKTYSIGASEISVRFSWAPPALSQHPLTGYRIYWARVKLYEGHSTLVPTIERDPFTVVVLSQRELSYTINNLTAGARYIVKLQALSSIGGGASVAVDIKTPNMTLNPQIPKPTFRPPVNTVAPDRSSQAIATQDNKIQDNAAGRLVASTLVMSLLILTHYLLSR